VKTIAVGDCHAMTMPATERATYTRP
jgi:hypothetical protein